MTLQSSPTTTLSSKTNILSITAQPSQPAKNLCHACTLHYVLSLSHSLNTQKKKSPPCQIDTVRPHAAYGKQPFPSSEQNEMKKIHTSQKTFTEGILSPKNLELREGDRGKWGGGCRGRKHTRKKKNMSGMEELISIRQFPLNRAPKEKKKIALNPLNFQAHTHITMTSVFLFTKHKERRERKIKQFALTLAGRMVQAERKHKRTLQTCKVLHMYGCQGALTFKDM